MKRLVVLAMLMTGCVQVAAPAASPPTVTDPPPETTTSTSPTTTTTEAAAPTDLAGQIEATAADLDRFWAEAFPEHFDVAYKPVRVREGYDVRVGVPACGDETLERDVATDNAFYCSADDSIRWDEVSLFPTLYSEFGPIAVSLVLAHEWGHAIQHRAGVPTDLPTIVRELQADCFAGAWASWAGEGEGVVTVGPSDLDTATAGFLHFRDPTGTAAAEPGAHGNAFDRVGSFLDGMRGGVSVCSEYPSSPPLITQRPFLSPDDAARGGDVPFEELAPLLVPTLEVFWADRLASMGGSWDGTTGLGDSATDPRCATPEALEDRSGAVYCPDANTVVVDVDQVLVPLYGQFGDFGSAFVLALGWAQRAQVELGLPVEGPEATLQATCFTGAWTAAVAEGVTTGTDDTGNPVGGSLSPGDLDEAIQAILYLGEHDGGSAFERFEVFRDGFLDGVDGCVA